MVKIFKKKWPQHFRTNPNSRSFTLYHRKLKLKLQGNKCANKKCKSNVSYPKFPLWAFEGDHIIEVCDGGKTVPENLQVYCIGCHREKTKVSAKNRRFIKFTKRELKIISFLAELNNIFNL